MNNESPVTDNNPAEPTGRATYSPEDNKLRLYVGRVPREEFLKLRAEGWTTLHKQREAGVAAMKEHSPKPPNTPRPELFADVAQQFETGAQPLNLKWMQDRGVTLDELQAVSQQVALILRGYLALPPRDRILFVHRGVVPSPSANHPAG